MAAMPHDDAGGPWKEETDTVEAQFGGEYSDATLDMMRGLNKPEWMEEDSSLDPVEDMDEHLRLGFRVPPSSHDGIRAAAAEEISRLKEAKERRLDAEEEELIRYRKQLVEGTSVDDVKWLKLRAYYRAMDKMQQRQSEALATDGKRRLMELHGVPLDRVPHELIDLTPEQLADRWQRAKPVAASADESYSEDSEWAADWKSTSYLDNNTTRNELQAAFIPPHNYSVGSSLQSPNHAPAENPPEHPLGGFGKILDVDDPNNRKEWKPVHGLTPEYVAAQKLFQRLKVQQQQRALAFWLPLAGVLGIYALKGVKRLLRPKARDPKGGPKQALQQMRT